MSNFRVDLKEDNGDLKGTITFPADDRFTLEAISMIIETFSERTGYDFYEILADLYQLRKDTHHEQEGRKTLS